MKKKRVLTDKNSAECKCARCGRMGRVYKMVMKGTGGHEQAYCIWIRCEVCGDYSPKRTQEYFYLTQNLVWVKSKNILLREFEKDQKRLI